MRKMLAATAAAMFVLALSAAPTATAHVSPDSDVVDGIQFDCYYPDYVQIKANIRGHVTLAFLDENPDSLEFYSEFGYKVVAYTDHHAHHGASTYWDAVVSGGQYADIDWARASCQTGTP